VSRCPPGNIQPAGGGAGGQHNIAGGQLPAVFEQHHTIIRLQGCRLAGQKPDSLLREPFRPRQLDLFAAAGAEQIVLTQRRAVIGEAFGIDDGYLPPEAPGPQFAGRGESRHAAACNDDGFKGHVFFPR
jgi:hypothetical protein